jgi:hypothetical protein
MLAVAAAFPAAARACAWRPPVSGPVTRGFEPGAPYEGGLHRGVDFGAAPGEPVRAACAGRAVVARRVGSAGNVVTIRCGPWRASHLPLATLTVREGALVTAGDRIGTAAGPTGHAGLHLGARREGRRFGYADPLRLMGAPPPPLAARPPAGERVPRAGPPRATPASPRLRSRPVRGMPAVRPLERARGMGSSPAGTPGRGELAPWPAWLGLAILLAGVTGAGSAAAARRRVRRAPEAVSRPAAEPVR